MSEADQWLTAYIGLGSNLDQPLQQVNDAVRDIGELAEVRILEVSPWYRTAPIGPQDQPDFINGVVKLATRLSANDLLRGLQDIEQTHGRVRLQRWGARSLDLDILLYGDRRIDSTDLKVPHPEMTKRAFVLQPLADIADAHLEIPGVGRLADALAACPHDRVERLAS